MMRRRVDLPEPLGPRRAVSAPDSDVERDILQGDEVTEALRDVANEDRHQAVSSLGRMTVMATRTRIAMSASTIEMAYAPARSKAS